MSIIISVECLCCSKQFNKRLEPESSHEVRCPRCGGYDSEATIVKMIPKNKQGRFEERGDEI